MGKGGIPDRWVPYTPMGSVIPGTPFIACKVPLKEDLLRRLPKQQRFGPADLMEAYPKMGLLVDLTNTTRYYRKQIFTERDIRYEKIFSPGQVVPPNSIVKKFFDVVDDFLANRQDPDAVIVVHCTHGVNRTGYFICRYMIQKMNMTAEEAVKNFQMARGHKIERENYVHDLKNGCKGGSERNLQFAYNQGSGNDRRRGSSGLPNFHPRKRERNYLWKAQGNNYGERNSINQEKWVEKSNRHYDDGERKKHGQEDVFSFNWRDHITYQNPPSASAQPPPPPSHRVSQQLSHHNDSFRKPHHPPPMSNHSRSIPKLETSSICNLSEGNSNRYLRGPVAQDFSSHSNLNHSQSRNTQDTSPPILQINSRGPPSYEAHPYRRDVGFSNCGRLRKKRGGMSSSGNNR